MYRILLFTDSKYRDLPSNVLLKHKLQKQIPNSIVVVSSFNIWQPAIELFSPHLVVLTHILGKRNKAIASFVHRNGGVVAVLHTEGIIEFSGKAAVFTDQKDSDYVDLFLCWNKEVSKLVGTKSVVVGSPRFDFYREPFSKLVDSRELFCDKYGLDSDRPILLMGDSWPSAKFKYSLRSFHRNDWLDLGNVKADKWADPDKFAEGQFAMQEQFKLYALAIVDAYPDTQVVVKSHPMSDFRRWSKWASEHGITLVHGEYMFNALNAADIYATKTGSITVAEAWLSGKNAIKIGQEYDSSSSLEQHEVDDFNVSSVGEFVDMVGELTPPPDSIYLEKLPEYMKKWGMVRRGLSSNIVAKKLGSLLDNSDVAPIREPHLVQLQQAIHAHDVQNDFPVIDGFGNFDKAIISRDVSEWYTKIEGVL